VVVFRRVTSSKKGSTKGLAHMREVLCASLGDRVTFAVEKVDVVPGLVAIEIDELQSEFARKALYFHLPDRDELAAVFGDLALREVVAQRPGTAADAIVCLKDPAANPRLP
jgi:hypothetical protein